MTRWLVTGAGGMLGTELVGALAGRTVTARTRAELDITDAVAVDDAVASADIVLNAAAYTNVDGAEAEPAQALAVNGEGPRVLAEACRRHGARLVHVSTDYVFAGAAADPANAPPYPETAPTAPATAYGRSKLAGERAVLTEWPRNSYVVRTAWVYGEHGRNFVRTMIELERTRPEIDVVDDQWGQPTWTRDLAARLVGLAAGDAEPGIYHVAGGGRATWFRLAREVFAAVGADPDRVRPTTTDRFPRPAPRPAFSVLGQDRLAKAGLPPMPPWQESLAAAMPALLRVARQEAR
jgi:dTDP-4-dehydrorhamnose reductase